MKRSMSAVREVTQSVVPSASRQIGLDDLDQLEWPELLSLYRSAPEPVSLTPLDGHPVCRGMALRFMDSHGERAARLRQWARTDTFPWAGKSFQSASDTRGTGYNRLRLAGLMTGFPFITSIKQSVIDGRDCIHLDYDIIDNPPGERACVDELREVSSGIFMGPVFFIILGKHRQLAWFGIDTNRHINPPYSVQTDVVK